MLCPELVGRDREQGLLEARVGDLAEGRGGLVVLVGEAGAGKSRLARSAVDLAVAQGIPVLTGRSVPGASPSPYRPLTEAFLAAFRASSTPDDPSLAGFGSHLGRLVPAWQAELPGADESPVLLGEAVVRLLVLHGGGAGCVLLLEDLHWADAETIAVLDYLADALRTEPVLCVCTSRPQGAADELLGRLVRRDPSALVAVAALGDADVDRMLAACLGEAVPSGALTEFVHRHSDGTPFLVEELLAGLVSSGELRLEDGRWTSDGVLTPTVPGSFRESIQRRLASLDATTRRVLGAAALLGRSFDWELLPGIAEVDGRAVVDGLRAAVDEQLIVVDGAGFTFRHALTREAVLADLLPPERHDLATRAWPAHERANPGLPGPTLELAADLAEAAGQRVAASRHLVESTRRAQVNGALVTAEATARRAVRLAEGDAAAIDDADEALVHVLVAAGKPGEARVIGRTLAARLATAGAGRREADVLLVTARAALAAGDVTDAARDASAARDAAGDADPAVLARLDVVAAAVALGEVDLVAAKHLAEAAAAGGARTGQPAVECEALLVAGHVVRTEDGMDAALPWYERAGEVAAAAGLAQLHLQAQQEQALVVWTRGDVEPLHAVRDLAARYGALITVAAMDLSLADIALSSYDREACYAAATACVDASRRYGLATEPVATLWLAGAQALRGDAPAMDAAIDAVLALTPDDPRILGDLYGRVLPTAAFVDDDLARLPGLLDTMIEHVRVAPQTTSVYPGRILWAMVHTVDDDDLGLAARAEFAEAAERIGLVVYRGCLDLIEAVALGREGDADAATARFDPAYEQVRARPVGAGAFHSYALILSRAALRDGWGDPVRWLREAEAFFGGHGYDRLARRCRLMLGEAGAPVPRRGRGDSEVPLGLRAVGVTSREVDVLKLVAAGCTNKAIAEALVLSPKTVERHLSSLFTRLDVANRRDLAEAAPPPPGGRRSLIGGRAPDDPHAGSAQDHPMQTNIHEIADGVYRLATVIPEVAPGGFTFNQYLIDGDEPMLFHTGARQLFPLVSDAVGKVIDVSTLRWVSFGHVESDECGSMNQWLAAAPTAEVVFNPLGCMVSLNDLCDRPPQPFDLEGQGHALGGHVVRCIPTPHVPHGWEAQVMFDETTRTLFCGDLFTQIGEGPAIVHDADLIQPALDAEDLFGATALTAATAPTLRQLAALEPRTLALMHGPAFAGDCRQALLDLADAYEARFTASLDLAVAS